MATIGPFSVMEFAGLIVALLGLVPVLSQYREDTKLFTAGYMLLVVGMFATNVENVVLPITLNFTEHGIGIGLAGLIFGYAAYHRRQAIVSERV